MITTQIELDVSPGGIAPVIHVSQYDTGSRTLLFNLIATAGDLILPSGVNAEIRGTKPDGNGFSYDCLINGKTAFLFFEDPRWFVDAVKNVPQRMEM